MSNNTSTASSGGIGLFGLLTVAFVVLKLCHVINWSWWWVLSPTLVPIGIAAVICLVALILWVLTKVLK